MDKRYEHLASSTFKGKIPPIYSSLDSIYIFAVFIPANIT